MITESRACYNGVHTRVLSTAGSGVPIVLLHGFMDSAETWRELMGQPAMAGRATLAVDMPGFGEADARAPGEILPQLDAFVDALVTELGDCVLAGNSLGACASVRAASRGSRAIRGVVAIDEPILASHWLIRVARRGRDPLRLLPTRLRTPGALHNRAVRAGFAYLLYRHPKAADPVVVARFADQAPDLAHVRELLVQAQQVAVETAAGYDTTRLACPLLVVHGRRDRIIPVHASRRLHASVPGSTLVVMPESGHCPQLDDPAGLAGYMLPFLDATLGGRNHQAG
ncbi:MAG: alpha/beta hydrolase fold protein [Nocardia sp.]|uniref:alpha/beta fold hydrolase n=1 Tax=Nocardia sp. TaxID=1821 RepID=UPI0026110CA0|nr:alpha/beta hydrolase [Nocardia sp.]MCU1639867.1 alpha/beta hydrolase fold protein [Nocardia sp.]